MHTATQLLERCSQVLHKIIFDGTPEQDQLHNDIRAYLAKQQSVEIEPMTWQDFAKIAYEASAEYRKQELATNGSLYESESLCCEFFDLSHGKRDAWIHGCAVALAQYKNQQVEQEQHLYMLKQGPVYWDVIYDGNHVRNIHSSEGEAKSAMHLLNAKHEGEREVVPLYTSPLPSKQIEQEPLGTVRQTNGCTYIEWNHVPPEAGTVCYAAPQAREPISEEELQRLCFEYRNAASIDAEGWWVAIKNLCGIK